MSNLGFGVMLGILGGNAETVEAVKNSLGKTITKISLNNDKLAITFEDKTRLVLWDDGQSCCEYRYMTLDDTQEELDYFIGAELRDIEIADGGVTDNDWDVHEIQFLRIITSKDVLVLSSHNEHNGYYGGIWIVARLYEID